MHPKTLFVLVLNPFILGAGKVAEEGQTLNLPYHFARELISANKVRETEDPAIAIAAAEAVNARNAAAAAPPPETQRTGDEGNEGNNAGAPADLTGGKGSGKRAR